MSLSSPKDQLPHIVLVGPRNVGKYSLMNALTGQACSLVSKIAGTTTDPVERRYELQPLGAVVWMDTAGIDDRGELGELRVARTLKALKQADVLLIVFDAESSEALQETICTALPENIPRCIVLLKSDLLSTHDLNDKINQLTTFWKQPVLAASTLSGLGLNSIKDALVDQLQNTSVPELISDIVQPGELVILVVPIDKEAPVGRIIHPQAQVLRALLDRGAMAMVVRDTELAETFRRLAEPPALVITDSQAFEQVSHLTPKTIRITSFSILFARQKGNLSQYAAGAKALENLVENRPILIAESCSHRPIGEDIGRVKIPHWLRTKTGLDLTFDVYSGKDWPNDLTKYQLIIQCGGCMANRPFILSRLEEAQRLGIPMTNYGVVIASLKGIIDRALDPFPEALAAYRNV